MISWAMRVESMSKTARRMGRLGLVLVGDEGMGERSMMSSTSWTDSKDFMGGV